jgi:hypothetical protein
VYTETYADGLSHDVSSPTQLIGTSFGIIGTNKIARSNTASINQDDFEFMIIT